MIHSVAATASEESLHSRGSNVEAIDVGIMKDAKSSAVISEDIDRFLPMEVSSAESEDGDGDDDENLLDEIDDQEQAAPREDAPQEGAPREDAPQRGARDLRDSDEKDLRGRPSSCVFVASLAASLSDDELCISVTDSFKQYGELARVKVLRDHANRPYAFVQYKSDKYAKRALKMAQGSVLNGRTLRCESARVNRTLFITHAIPLHFTRIAELCEKFGELEQVVPNREQNHFNKKSNYPAPTGHSWFIQFAYRDDAIRAFANLRSDPEWDVEWVQNIEVPRFFNLLSKKSSNNNSNDDDDDDDDDDDCDDEDLGDVQNNGDKGSFKSEEEFENFDTIDKKSIFIGQLDSSVTREKLIDRFSNHGKIVDTNLINKSTNVFAFIQFETEEAAAAALERENHAIFLNRTMHVQYKVIGGHHNKRHGKKNSGSKNFMGPQVNLAPPPINMYRRRSYEHEPMMPYITSVMPSHSDFEINPYNPYMKNAYRRTSLPSGWSSARSFGFKSESENTFCGDGATDATSDASASAGKSNSATTYNNSSAGSIGQNNPNSNENTKNNAYKNKKKFSKRNTYNEPPKPYYFQPYYYHPMHYRMGPMGPTHPSPGPGGNQPYMMVYPMPPPPPTGVDGAMMAPPMPMGQSDPRIHGSQPIGQNPFVPNDSNDYPDNNKPYNLDY